MLSKTITLKTMTALLLSFRSCSQRLVHTPTWINLYMRVNDCLTNKHSASSCVLTEQWTKNHRTIVSWSKNSSWFICPCVGPPSHLSPTSPEENIRIKDYKSLQWHLLGDQMGLTESKVLVVKGLVTCVTSVSRRTISPKLWQDISKCNE